MFRVVTEEGNVRKGDKLVIFKSLSKAVTVAAELRKKKFKGVKIISNYYLVYGRNKSDDNRATNASGSSLKK